MTQYMPLPPPYWQQPEASKQAVNAPEPYSVTLRRIMQATQTAAPSRRYARVVPHFDPDAPTVATVVENARARRERVAQVRAALARCTTVFESENKRHGPPEVIVAPDGSSALLIGCTVQQLQRGEVAVVEVD